MHEMSLLNDLMAKIGEIADREQAEKVIAVKVWIGAMTNISADHFREHFTQASAGTICEEAFLDVEVSDDVYNSEAQSFLLKSIEVDSGP